jgi:hypothetical protein
MQSLRTCLEAYQNQERFEDELCYFFSNNQQILHRVLVRTANGRLFKQIVTDVLRELSNFLQDPIRAVNAVLELNIPMSRYQLMSRFNKR